MLAPGGQKEAVRYVAIGADFGNEEITTVEHEPVFGCPADRIDRRPIRVAEPSSHLVHPVVQDRASGAGTTMCYVVNKIEQRWQPPSGSWE